MKPKEPGQYFTLNRRSTKATNPDPYSALQYNIEVDSRLRGGNSESPQTTPTLNRDRCFSLDMRPLGKLTPLALDVNEQHHSLSDLYSNSSSSSPNTPTGVVPNTGAAQGKQLAREVLTQHIKAVAQNGSRPSNGVINHTPISTRGEATNDTSYNLLSAQKRSSSNSPHRQRTPLAIDHMTTFHKAGSAPPTLPLEGEVDKNDVAMSIISKAQGSKHLNMLGIAGKPPSPSTLRGAAYCQELSPLATSTTNKSVEGRASSDNAFTHSSGTEISPDQQRRSEYGSGQAHPGPHRLYDQLDPLSNPTPSASTDPSSQSETITPTEQSMANKDMFSVEMRRAFGASRNTENRVSIYDHLPDVEVATPTPPDDNEKPAKEKPNKMLHVPNTSGTITLGVTGEIPRRISQPALSTPNSARESPCDLSSDIAIDDEFRTTPTNSDDEEWLEEAVTPCEADFTGVTLRQKKKQELMTADPFADIMSPKSASRLRWSQELNPLYEYIKRFKISDGVKMYDSTPSKLVQHKSATGVIEEETEDEGDDKEQSVIMEGDEGDEECSILGWDPSDTMSLTSSQDTISLMSQDTQHSPTSPTSSCGGDSFETMSLTGRVSGRGKQSWTFCLGGGGEGGMGWGMNG